VSCETPFSKVLDESNAPFFKWFKGRHTQRLLHLWELPVMIQFGASTARHEPGGWMRWPEYKDRCFQFMRFSRRSTEGASTISECFVRATRITPGDESWHLEWKRIADVGKARGDSAIERGYVEMAKRNWLRASSYYRSAEYF
jgi:hypothetical protein